MLKLITSKPIAVTMIGLAVLVFGLLSSFRLPLELMPELNQPTLTVRTEYVGAAPEEVESDVSRLVEERLTTISGLRTTTSLSKPELSDVVLTFSWDTDLDRAVQDVREKVDRIRFKDDVGKPLVLRYDPSLEPMLSVAFLVKNNDVESLRSFLEDMIQPALNVLGGVAHVKLLGGSERQILVELDEMRMADVGISPQDINSKIRSEDVNVAGGKFVQYETEFLVRVVHEYTNLEDLRNLVVGNRGDAPIRLNQLAKVDYYTPPESIKVSLNNNSAISLEIFRESGANIVQVSKKVKNKLEQYAKKFPNIADYHITWDQAELVTQSIAELRNTAIFGGFFAIFVIWLFLNKVSSTLIVGISIPVSIVMCLGIMYIQEVPLNTMSLGGLALGVGMMVDNSIVVLESIVRRKEEGASAAEAAIQGTLEVLSAIVASTLTTVAVFFPVTFLQGIAGQIFSDFAWAVVFSLLSSLVVAVFLIPMLAARTVVFQEMKPKKLVHMLPYFSWTKQRWTKIKSKCENAAKWIQERFQLILDRINTEYPSILVSVLERKKQLLILVLASFCVAFIFFVKADTELLPQMSDRKIHLNVALPVGTSVDKTEAWSKDFIASLKNGIQFEDTFIKVGAEEGDSSSEASSGPHMASFVFNLDKISLTQETKKKLADYMANEQDVLWNFKKPGWFKSDDPIQLRIFSNDLTALTKVSHVLNEVKVEGLNSQKVSLSKGFPEILVKPREELLSHYDLSATGLAAVLQDLIKGKTEVDLKADEQDYDILVRQSDDRLASVADIGNLHIGQKSGRSIPLISVADLALVEGPSEIRRVDRRRAINFSAQLDRKADLDTVNSQLISQVEALLTEKGLLSQVSLELAGDNLEKDESEREMLMTLALALFLIYVVLASQFESFLQPFIILGSVPLAGIGIAFVLFLFDLKLGIMVFIGMIMLSGIVVNNGIVLVDAINRQRKEVADLGQAIVIAGRRRLRPILMTSLSTVLGLIPMAIGLGEGAELRSPMAITVIGGLISSTLLTLFFIPVLYHSIALVFGKRGEDL